MRLVSENLNRRLTAFFGFVIILGVATASLPIVFCLASLKFSEVFNAMAGSVWLSLPLAAAYSLRPKKEWEPEKYLQRLLGIIGAILVYVVTHSFFYYVVWTSRSSTAGIVLISLPFYDFGLMATGYFLALYSTKLWLMMG